MSCSHEDRDASVVYNNPYVVEDDHDYPRNASEENVNDTDHHPQIEEKQYQSHGLEQGNAAGEKPDIYNFWIGEGDYHTIRHAQGKKLYVNEIIICLFSSYANIQQHSNINFHSSFNQTFCHKLASSGEYFELTMSHTL